MAVGQIVIVKSTAWQGRSEDFSNVYNLHELAATAEAGEAAIDSIVALERAVHGSNVTFKEARAYVFRGLAGYEGTFRKALNVPGLHPTPPEL